MGEKDNPHQGQEQLDLPLSVKHFAEVEGVEEVEEVVEEHQELQSLCPCLQS